MATAEARKHREAPPLRRPAEVEIKQAQDLCQRLGAGPADAASPDLRVVVRDPEGTESEADLPPLARTILDYVLAELAAGNGLRLSRLRPLLTQYEAAGLLGVSPSRVTEMMDRVKDSLVSGHLDLVPILTLPDPADRHVLAAAIFGRAEVIVTFNLKDFPRSILTKHGVEPQHPDDFLLAVLVAREAAFLADTLITVADDFIVDVYHNGVLVPDDRRELIQEIHRATVERIKANVRQGDWLVFHVVNNKMRWGGASYFAVKGLGGERDDRT